MPITQDDVRFRASRRMTDFADGGGPRSTTVIVDGVDNDLFDDITDIDRLSGVLSLRKVYGAALNAGTSAYLSAHALLDVPPSDPAASAFVMATGGVGTERAAALAAVLASSDGLSLASGGVEAESGTVCAWLPGALVEPPLTHTLYFLTNLGQRWVVAVSSGTYPGPGGGTAYRWEPRPPATGHSRSCGAHRRRWQLR